MRALTHLAAALSLLINALPGCATTLEDAIAEKGLYGACLFLEQSGANYAAVDAKVRPMFEKLFPAEFKIERVTSRDANGKAVNPMQWGELITVHWRIKHGPLPPGVTGYDFVEPQVWFSAMEPKPVRPNVYIAQWGLSERDAARMLTGKRDAFSQGKTSFWGFMKSVFVDVPTLAISGGLVGSLGEGRASLYDAVLKLRGLVNRRCSYDPDAGRNWPENQCWTTKAIIPNEEAGGTPTHLYFKAPHGLLNRHGHSCGLFSRGRMRLPPGGTVGERAAALFQGQWRPLTDFEHTPD